MQTAEFDLICLGSGPAGQKAAIQAAKAGYRAAIIERDPQVGGSCLLSGTIPSKALREQALRYRRMKCSASSLAVELRGDAPLSALLQGVDVVIAGQDKYLQAQLSRNQVELIRGRGVFLDANRVEVQHLDAQNLFADAVIADIDSGKLSARIGRQELLFGAQRLLSPLDWANTRRTFEGGRMTWSNDDQTTDFLLVRPLTLNIDRFDSPNQNQALYGIYNSNKTFTNGPIDTYWLGYEDAVTDLNVQTLGTLIKGEADNTLWDNEFGYQFGRNPDGSVTTPPGAIAAYRRYVDAGWSTISRASSLASVSACAPAERPWRRVRPTRTLPISQAKMCGAKSSRVHSRTTQFYRR